MMSLIEAGYEIEKELRKRYEAENKILKGENERLKAELEQTKDAYETEQRSRKRLQTKLDRVIGNDNY